MFIANKCSWCGVDACVVVTDNYGSVFIDFCSNACLVSFEMDAANQEIEDGADMSHTDAAYDEQMEAAHFDRFDEDPRADPTYCDGLTFNEIDSGRFDDDPSPYGGTYSEE